ncbi:MAG: hypothetical protein LLG06_13005 [Desulfobacteraceae bacterium]|nr:hypothetical protein [Desulfobacteraceae bacterium]
MSSALLLQDRLGTFRVRCGIGRMDYKVDPGLYAIGNPEPDSPVLLSANYKMSFDRLRESLPGRDAWILVLDTDGINVWCAAGKGTFGTEEVVGRVASSGLSRIVEHRRLIAPQLGAPGIAAHEVKRRSGFNVVYGPVEAGDLPRFLDSGCRAEPDMRIKKFGVSERLAVIPVELAHTIAPLLAILPVLFLLSGFGSAEGGFWEKLLRLGPVNAAGFLAAVFSGCIAAPALLPWLPGRAFALKGGIAGIVFALLYLFFRNVSGAQAATGPLETLAWLLIIPAVSAYLAMNFTGCSTFTSLSGVKKEMRWAVPMEAGAGIAGALIWIVSRFA